MNVLMISTNRASLPMPVLPYGACSVAEAARRAGHAVRFLDLMFEPAPLHAVAREIAGFNPDAVGLSVRNIDNNDIRNPAFFIAELAPLVGTVRRLTNAPVVLGGAAVSVMPEEIMRSTGADCAVTGDGEIVFPRLLERLSGNRGPSQVPGTAWIEDDVFRAFPSFDYSSRCPAPDFGCWIRVRAYLSRMAAAPLQTKLGCHFQCVYCTYRKIEGPSYRLFNAGDVLDAVRRYAAYGFRDIEFVDNVFNSPYDHAAGLCEQLARIRPGIGSGVRFQSLEMNPLFIDDGLIALMERAGFSGIGITAESASDRVLSGLQKGFSAGDVYRAAEVVRRHNLPCIWIFMLGGPGETESTVKETLDFARCAVRAHDAAFFNPGVRIYPGTALEAIARDQGVLTVPPKEMLAPVFYISPEIQLDRMLRQVREAMDGTPHFISSDSIGMSLLSGIQRMAFRLGIRPPLWRYTSLIRRGLRLFGVDA